jgi:hypothetical protein
VWVDGSVVGEGALRLAAPIADVANSVFHVGQRAPGRFPLVGLVLDLAVSGFERTPNGVSPPAVSIGQMWSRNGADGASASVVVPTVSATFSVGVSLVMDAGARGYVFARTDLSGSVRRYALYVPSSGRVRLYYRPVGAPRNRIAYFNVVINDARVHAVLLTVAGQSATLRVDEQVASTTLVGAIEDCSGSDCVFHVGQRAGGQGRATWVMHGTVGGLIVHPTAVHASYPRHGAFRTVSLIDPANGVVSGNAATAAAPHSLSLGGAGHFELLESAEVFGQSSNPSLVSIAFSQSAAGYLIARTDASGVQRFFAVYSGTTSFTMYYRSGGAQRSQSFPHTANFTAASSNTLLVSQLGSPTTLSVSLDGVLLGSVVVPQGLDSCSSAVCRTWIGRRQPSNFALTGAIHHAVAHTIF